MVLCISSTLQGYQDFPLLSIFSLSLNFFFKQSSLQNKPGDAVVTNTAPDLHSSHTKVPAHLHHYHMSSSPAGAPL